MEVHHHTHTPRQKWTHYFWEFLMLFLAVFCGFLAEYQLEHKIERDRAKELAINFYDELSVDSAAVSAAISNRMKKDAALVYLKNYFKDSNLIHCSKTFVINFYSGLMSTSPSVFEPRNVVLQQLQNSGSLRYFKNKEMQNLVGELSVAITNVHERNNLELTFSQQHVQPFLIKYNDQDWFDRISKSGTLFVPAAIQSYENSYDEIPFYLNKAGSIDKKEAGNMIGLFQIIVAGTHKTHYLKYDSLNRKLRKVLRKAYQLK